MADSGRQARRLRQERGLGQRKGRNGHIGEIIDDQVEPLATEARQDGLDFECARERAVYGVDDEGRAEPHEHHLPVAPRSRLKRKEREHGSACRQEMHRSGAEPCNHARRTGLADAALDSAEAALGGVRRETARDLAEDGDVAILLTAGRA